MRSCYYATTLLLRYYYATTATSPNSFLTQLGAQYDPEADGGALLPEGSRLPIAVYNVTGVAKFAKEMEYKGLGTPKVSLSFLMSKSGTVELVEAKATVEEMVEVKEKPKDKKKKDKAEKKKKDKAEKKKKAAEEAEAEADAEAEAEAEGDDADADPKMETDADADADADAADAEAEAEVEAEPEVKMKKKVHKAELTVVVSHDGLDYHALSEAHKTYATDRLAEIRRLDVLRHKKDALKNDLEALALSTRGKMRDLEEEVEAVSTEAQREAAMTLFQETEDWLYVERAVPAAAAALLHYAYRLLLLLTTYAPHRYYYY